MKGNTNQEINKQQATEIATPNGKVTIEPTVAQVTREIYDNYTKELTQICNTVRSSSIDVARIFTEMDELKVLDYAIDEKDGNNAVRFQSMSTYAEAVLGIELSDRQLSDYKKVIHKFGVRGEDGTYTIEDKYKSYGFTALEVIGRKCDSKDDFDKVLALYQLSSNMPVKKISAAIKAKDNEGKPENNTPKKGEDNNPKKETSEQLKETKKELEETKKELEVANNVSKGCVSHLKDIYKLAQDNNLNVIIEYYKKWKLDETISK